MEKVDIKRLFLHYWWVIAAIILVLLIVITFVLRPSAADGDNMSPEELSDAENKVAKDIYVPESKGVYINNTTFTYTDSFGNVYSFGVILNKEDSENAFGIFINPSVKAVSGHLVGLYLDAGQTGILNYSDQNDFFNSDSPELKSESCASIFRTYDQLDPVSFKSLDDFGVYWSDSGYKPQEQLNSLSVTNLENTKMVLNDAAMYVDVRAVDLVSKQMQAIFRVNIEFSDGGYRIVGITDSTEQDPAVKRAFVDKATEDLAAGVPGIISVGAVNENHVFVHPVDIPYFSALTAFDEKNRKASDVYAEKLYAVTANIGGSFGAVTMYYDYSKDEKGNLEIYYIGHDFLKPFSADEMVVPYK